MPVIIHIQISRYLHAHSQTFNIIPTPKRHILIIFGSTGNAYAICIKRNFLSCNCPDQTSGCKHIIFLLSVLGYLKNHQSHITINPLSVLPKLSQTTLPPKLQASYLDHHTANLCSAFNYAPCFFCAKKHTGSIVICSECGYLAHKHCYYNYLTTNTDRYDPNYCPKCGLLFSPLDYEYKNGYHNYYFDLKHRNHRTALSTNLHDDTSLIRVTNNNVPHFQPIVEDI